MRSLSTLLSLGLFMSVFAAVDAEAADPTVRNKLTLTFDNSRHRVKGYAPGKFQITGSHGRTSGTHALYVKAGTSKNGSRNYGGCYIDVSSAGIVADRYYRIRYKARAVKTAGSIHFSHQSGDGGETALSHTQQLATSFQTFEHTAYVGERHNRIYISAAAAHFEWVIDDIRIDEVVDTDYRMLYVVGPQEIDWKKSRDTRKSELFKKWGYDVTFVSQSESKAKFEQLADEASVAYISETVYSSQVTTKLNNLRIGVLTDELYLADDIGFGRSLASTTGGYVDIRNRSHFITRGISRSRLNIPSRYSVGHLKGMTAGDVLATYNRSHKTLLAVERGEKLVDGAPAKGRRVFLGFLWPHYDEKWQSEVKQLVRNAIYWAAADRPQRAVRYYVSTRGNDRNDGKSVGRAFRTINKAANTVIAGDTVYIAQGTYRETASFRRKGKSGSPIRFIGRGSVVLQPATKNQWSVNMHDADHTVFENIRFSGANVPAGTGWAYGLYNYYSEVTFKNCDFEKMLYGSYNVYAGVKFEDCKFHDNPSHSLRAYYGGVKIDGCEFNKDVYGPLLYRNHFTHVKDSKITEMKSWALQIAFKPYGKHKPFGSHPPVFQNCTIDNNGNGLILTLAGDRDSVEWNRTKITKTKNWELYPGRLHAKSLSEQDFREVCVIPACVESLVLDTNFG